MVSMRTPLALLLLVSVSMTMAMAEDWRPMVRTLSRQSRKADGGGHGAHGHGHVQHPVVHVSSSFTNNQVQSGRAQAPVQRSQATRFTSSNLPRRGREEAAPPAYELPGSEDPSPVDLHNKEFCVDVSTYDPVTWVEKEAEACETTFVKECSDKTENVCANVTETACQVVPYTVCEMGLEPQEAVSTKLAPKLFVEKVCTQGKKEIPHTKMLPECKNVTKQNCVTLWETDADGKQVWAGTDACEPVTWQECKLVPKDVKFIVPEIKCEPKQELWYHEPEEMRETRMTNTYGCKTESTTDCVSTTRPDCKPVSWQECREVAVNTCNPKSIHVPVQEKQHRKKCLLPDDRSDEAPAGYGAPPPSAPAPPSYGAPAQPSYAG